MSRFVAMCALGVFISVASVKSTRAGLAFERSATPVEDARWQMSTEGSLDADGAFEANIRTWAGDGLEGFSGRAIFVLKNANDEIVHLLESPSYGVNSKTISEIGSKIFGREEVGASDRTERFTATLDPELAATVTRIEVEFQRYGRPSEERLDALLVDLQKTRLYDPALLEALDDGRPLIYEFAAWRERMRARGAATETGVAGDALTIRASGLAGTVIGGVETSEHPAIGVLRFAGRTHCTGTLVHPSVVLTAAHCLKRGGNFYDTTRMDFSIGADANSPSWTAKLRAAKPHHAFKPLSSGGYENDIGLVRLSEPALAATMDLPSSDLSRELYGSTIEFFGYGYWLPNGIQGKKAKTWQVVDLLQEKTFTFSARGTSLCRGDSGGPGLFTVGGVANPVVAGVTSFGDAACKSHGVITRVDAHRPWISETLKEFEKGG